MTNATTIDLSQTAKDVQSAIEEAGQSQLAAEVAQAIQGADASAGIPVSGDITSYLLYSEITCVVQGGETFSGRAGGISTPGKVGYTGTLFLTNGNSIEQLYANTTAYLAVPAAPGFSLTFFDANHSSLATVAAVLSGPMGGIMGGKGSWD